MLMMFFKKNFKIKIQKIKEQKEEERKRRRRRTVKAKQVST